MKKLASIGLLLLVFCVGVSFAAEDPFSFAKKRTEEIINIVSNRSLNESVKRGKIENIIDGLVDWDYVSRSVLGIHYRRISKHDFETFKKKFRDYISYVYAKKFIKYNGEKINFLKDEKFDGSARIYAEVITNDSKRIPVIAVVRQVGDKWLVADIYIEGVSMVANYRSQINNVITQKGFRALLDMLDRRA
ncbi:MAG: MlaC/ttg2D family ABC transporter substrate-binding protein [Thermosulfidibacteraceae bacterium]|jgi:phospholipid transport system substrate-binding protein